MLDLIRNNVQSFGVKFLVAIVVVVMTFFGVSAYRSQGINTIATIDGYEIKVEKYQRAFEQAQNDIRQRFKSQAADYMKMINLPSQIVQQLVNSALLLKSAERMGLAVTDYELAQTLFETPSFQTDNRFDQKKYERMLTNNRIDRLLYEKDLRENILTEKYVQLITSGVLISREFVEEEYRRFKTEMTVNIIEYKPEMFASQITVTDAELNAYYEGHKNQFQQKKQFVIQYFPLTISDAKDKVIVREKEIKRYYEKNKNSEFSTKASFLTRHILIATPQDKNEKGMIAAKNKALDLHRQLKKQPARFPALANKFSADPVSAKQGGTLGWVEKGTFLREFEAVVDRLQKNELSSPFLTNYGYHIVELLDNKPSEIKPFETVQAQITDTIRKRKATRRLNNKVSKLVKQFGEKSLKDLATDNGKAIVVSKPFDDSKNLKDLGYTYQLYQEIKDKKQNDRGQFSLSGDAGVIVYEISEVVDPFIKPLKDIKESVTFLAKSEKAKKVAKEKLNQGEKSASSKSDFDRLAKQLGVVPQDVTFAYADRQSGQFRIGDNFRNETFKMRKSEVKAITEGEQNYLVYMTDKKAGAAVKWNEKQYEGLVSQLKQQKANILIGGLIEQLKTEMDVEYNQSILSALDIKYN